MPAEDSELVSETDNNEKTKNINENLGEKLRNRLDEILEKIKEKIDEIKTIREEIFDKAKEILVIKKRVLEIYQQFKWSINSLIKNSGEKAKGREEEILEKVVR